jgi:endonuclease/exonuclease/phosphatase family metal-dependent hydrolase
MRNGPPDADTCGEDRGNAILSTLPLSDFTAIELPLERERRVAVAAAIQGAGTDGMEWNLKLACVHLESRGRWDTFYRGLGDARLDQVECLVNVLQSDDAILVGGDFNTWFMGAREPSIRLMREHFPQPVKSPEAWTAMAPFGLPDPQVDYIFFRLPEGWKGRYSVIQNSYGSDHLPLLGWVVVKSPCE